MKLSTINWLSRAIALPVFITIIHNLPANASPIDGSRIALDTSSRNVEYLPSVTDLNLAVPVPARAIAPANIDRNSSIQPMWSQNRQSATSQSSRERISKTSSIGRKNNTSISKLKSSIVLNVETQNKSQLTSRRKNLVATTIESPNSTAKLVRKSRSNSKILAAVSPTTPINNYLRLVKDPSKGTNDVGNPIYTLEAYVDGQKYQTFDVVSGTANTQNADRNLGNNGAPLPDGLYEVSNTIVPGTVPEVGKTFVGIYPKFETGRRDLGIHLDRSFNQRNGYDGTAGCIGITSTADRDAINEFILKYHPHNLFVKIAPEQDR